MPGVLSSIPALFRPTKVGTMNLLHRVAMAPLTRFRAEDSHAHSELAIEYYRQRSSVPGTLIVTEATLIDPRAGGFNNVPGIWTGEQITQWRKIVNVVHKNGSFIYLQLWALGRAANAGILDKEGLPYVSSGDVQLEGHDGPPRPLTVPEIEEYVSYYARAARFAVNDAGFDGVEIHGANGYLPDQFLQDVTNNRTDAYGGVIEQRARFHLEVVAAVVGAVGAARVGLRLSPWERFNGMGMVDPIPTFSYLITRIAALYPDFAYLHLTEARVEDGDEGVGGTLDFARKLWKPRPLLVAGGYDAANGLATADSAAKNGENLIVAFGRHFISNPDLPLRIKQGIALTPYSRESFYTPKTPIGYVDYPFAVSAQA